MRKERKGGEKKKKLDPGVFLEPLLANSQKVFVSSGRVGNQITIKWPLFELLKCLYV